MTGTILTTTSRVARPVGRALRVALAAFVDEVLIDWLPGPNGLWRWVRGVVARE